MQIKLLRVLQERQFYPLGGEKPIGVNIRILTATNKNLQDEVKKGRFREDLFYRIYVIPIHLPPLRERKEDIPFLVDQFIKKIDGEMKKGIKGITAPALEKLMSYSFPGNVRELENIIEYVVAMATQKVIDDDLVLLTKPLEQDNLKPLKEAKNEFEKRYVSKVLSLVGGNVSQAAQLAGKYRSDFYALLKKHDLNPSDFKRKNRL